MEEVDCEESDDEPGAKSLPVLVLCIIGALGAYLWPLPAQELGTPARRDEPTTTARSRPDVTGQPTRSVEEALCQRVTLTFRDETALEDVANHFRRVLKVQVVLDLAALQRQELTPSSTVQLELVDARLKTALKLLLDQLGLTYRVVVEDNLLIITDAEGSEDADQAILGELRAIHREVHELQDAVDELREMVDPGSEEGAVKGEPREGDPSPARTRPG